MSFVAHATGGCEFTELGTLASHGCLSCVACLKTGAYETILRDAMTADSFDPVGLYFGTRSGQLFGSRDEGRTWQKILEGLPSVVAERIPAMCNQSEPSLFARINAQAITNPLKPHLARAHHRLMPANLRTLG